MSSTRSPIGAVISGPSPIDHSVSVAQTRNRRSPRFAWNGQSFGIAGQRIV